MSFIKIELNPVDCTASVKTITSKKTGEVLKFREQKAYIYNGGIYPKQFIISLDDNQPEYPAGIYTIAPESIDVGDFGALKFASRIKLIPSDKK